MEALKVAVVMGGVSPEHDISIRSGATVLGNLPGARYRCMAVVIRKNGLWCLGEGMTDPDELAILAGSMRPEIAMAELMEWGVDVAFLALHGPNGEDGTIQGFFQSVGVPYTGSGVEASAASMNKYTSKVLAAWTGVRIPQSVLVSRSDWREGRNHLLEGPMKEIGFPAFVKTLRSGSSIGIFRVEKAEELQGAVEEAFQLDDALIIEKEIPGREITCGVLGGSVSGYRALPPVEIKPKGECFFAFQCKYDPERAEEICPAPLTKDERGRVEKASLALSRRFGIRGVCRIDFILNGEGLWFLELNAIPGLTAESIVPKEAIEAGMSLPELMERIILSALEERTREKTDEEWEQPGGASM